MHVYIAIPMQEYYWRVKCWHFYSKIVNHQSLLLANSLSYTALHIRNKVGSMLISCTNDQSCLLRCQFKGVALPSY